MDTWRDISHELVDPLPARLSTGRLIRRSRRSTHCPESTSLIISWRHHRSDCERRHHTSWRSGASSEPNGHGLSGPRPRRISDLQVPVVETTPNPLGVGPQHRHVRIPMRSVSRPVRRSSASLLTATTKTQGRRVLLEPQLCLRRRTLRIQAARSAWGDGHRTGLLGRPAPDRRLPQSAEDQASGCRMATSPPGRTGAGTLPS